MMRQRIDLKGKMEQPHTERKTSKKIRVPIETIKKNLQEFEQKHPEDHFALFGGLLARTVFNRPNYTDIDPKKFAEECQYTVKKMYSNEDTLKADGGHGPIIANSHAYKELNPDLNKISEIENGIHQLAGPALGEDHPQYVEFGQQIHQWQKSKISQQKRIQ